MEELVKKLKIEEKYNQNYSINEIIKILEQKDKRIAELEQELAKLKEKAIVPKFKRNDFVYAIFTKTQIYKGQIDAFDYYTNSYLIYPNEDIGNEWIKANKVFKTKAEAEKKLQELRGGE